MAFGNSTPGSTLVAWHEAFWELVDPSAQLEVLAEKDYSFAHEAPVWLPDTNQVGHCVERTPAPRRQLQPCRAERGGLQTRGMAVVPWPAAR
jgi:hypothetical protein